MAASYLLLLMVGTVLYRHFGGNTMLHCEKSDERGFYLIEIAIGRFRAWTCIVLEFPARYLHAMCMNAYAPGALQGKTDQRSALLC